MNSNQVIHRDLKPENVLLSYDSVKIADFGLAVYTEDQMRSSFCGTPDYMSPELVSGAAYDYSVDIWSIGMLTYEFLVGRTPYMKKSEKNTMYMIENVFIN